MGRNTCDTCSYEHCRGGERCDKWLPSLPLIRQVTAEAPVWLASGWYRYAPTKREHGEMRRADDGRTLYCLSGFGSYYTLGVDVFETEEATAAYIRAAARKRLRSLEKQVSSLRWIIENPVRRGGPDA